MDRKTVIEFLNALGFKEEPEGSNIFVKKYSKHDDYEIKVKLDGKDIKKSLIYYNPERKTTEETTPEPNGFILLGDLTTSNFENPENFVVLEAVNRLLEIGYKPENIHLERKWKLGRTGKSGKADITVYYPTGEEGNKEEKKKRKTFMIVECKTWGEEYEKEKRRLFKNGGQLFSYFQQDRDTEILALYASTFEEKSVTYDSLVIRVKDIEELVEKCREKEENDDKPCSFEEAPDVPSLVDVWKRVYNQYTYKHGIFEEDAGFYSLDLKPLKKKDLKELKSSKGLFNAFAEILRHHNISDNANAFNKMLNLFLCKIVDEEMKKDEDILDFQIKLGESFEEVVDRLQNLYKAGMENYLGVKKFVYYSDEKIREIIEMFPKRTKLEEIEEIFKEIKYYTNNDFAFKEIHNKELFYQNALILSEVIELLQNYRIKYSHKNQILGDFFELLLNHGVKQSEGQFFTPLPLVRFMIISVAIDNYVENLIKKLGEKEEPLPKILDFACGAAHFLTEAIDEINKILKEEEIEIAPSWEGRYIYGIEKDYRLARTAKIACFLNGDGSANIIYGDGLDDYPELKLKERKFDFVLTNPPYSVKKFKNYLEVKPKYELLQYLTENSSEIEVLFLERAKQVLTKGGRAAIILPSSILSNSGVYEKARELLLKNFEIKGIAEFGSKTFIATGTNVVVLFLERRDDWFWKDRNQIAKEIFDEKTFAKNDYIEVEKLFEAFVRYRGLPLEDYKKFVFENELTEKLENTETFQSYRSWFNQLTEVKNLKKKKAFKNKSLEEQERELEELFLNKVREKEKEKFFYFSLLFKHGKKYNDPEWYQFQRIVVARAPSSTEEQKKYLGYEFNKRRGFEGIEIYRDERGKLTTKLYDEEDYYNPKKIASYIRKNFEGKLIEEIDEEVKPYLNVYSLPDLFDFEKVEFDKQINLGERKKEKKISFNKYPKVPLSNKLTFEYGKGLPKSKRIPGKYPVVGSNGIDGWHNEFLIDAPAVIVGRKGSAGKVNLIDKPCWPIDTTYYIKLNNPNENVVFYYYLLKYLEKNLEALSKGTGVPGLNRNDAYKLLIPDVPLEVQQKIVSDIEELEREEEDNKKLIKEKNEEVLSIVDGLLKASHVRKKLGEIAEIKSGGTPPRNVREYWENGTINWLRSEVCQDSYIYENQVKEKITEVGLRNSNAKIVPKNSILVALVGATLGKVGYLTFDSAINQNIAAIYNLKNLTPKILFYTLQLLPELRNMSERKYKMLSVRKLKEIELPIPPRDKQESITSWIESLEQEIEFFKKRNFEIQNLKQEVLKKYLQ